MANASILRGPLLAGILALALGSACSGTPPEGGGTLSASQEAAYRANNRGVALLEQFDHDSAVAAFREALELDPDLRLARLNLPIALFYAGHTDEAAAAAADARDRYPDAPQAPYMLGLIDRVENRPDEALASFQRVLELDPDDVGALVNLALVRVQQRDYAQAASLSRAALEREPYNATAAYNLAVALTRNGEPDEGQRMMARFQELRTASYAITYSQAYLEQGRYAEAVASTGAEPGLVDLATPAVAFTDATAGFLGGAAEAAPDGRGASPLAGGVALADVDADGDLDLLATGPAARLFRNDAATLADATRDVGLAALEGYSTGVVAGDFNNDSRADLLWLTDQGPRLFAQREDGRFDAVPDPSLADTGPRPARSAALVDVDHDGDLDVLVGGLVDGPAPAGWDALASGTPAASRLLRNNGDGTFADITSDAGLDGVATVVALAPTDYDNRRDVDLVMVSYGAKPKLFRNLRTGAFADVAATVGLPGADAYTSVALGDVNKDEFTDVFFGRRTGPGVWAMSDGLGRFRVEAAPAASDGTLAAQIIDYDNDGLLDLLTATTTGPRLFRNVGNGWRDETAAAFAGGLGARAVTALAAGDLDLDGDVDVVARLETGELQIWRNDGGNAHPALRVALQGLVSNRSGVGAKVEIRAGSLHQKLETASATPAPTPADLVFGLGARTEADVVRVLWPSGILQAETVPALSSIAAKGLAVEELNRRPSSCPFLFTWNGDDYAFVTDFMGGGEMGAWEAPGQTNVPDPEEYVRITDRQLRARDGRFELRVTNELEEVLFVDQLRLLAVTHPDDVTVFPDEGLRATPRPFRLFAARELRPLAGAWDDGGRNVLAELSALDGHHVDGFERLPFRGYARRHALTLELPVEDHRPSGDRSGGERRTLLLLTGWTDYAFSSDNVAAAQAGYRLSPPALQVPGEDGRWRTVDADVGFPVGRPQTLVVDVSPYAAAHRRLRIVTNMRVYWDRILVASASSGDALPVDDVPRVEADLRWRGFSARVAPDGRKPFGYDYAHVTEAVPWKLMPGRYTREGGVEELIAGADDRFVVSRSGDELVLAFDATALPALAPGMRRTFLLHSVGYSKEMDLHSASPDRAAPLPFHAMSRYPYAWPERYPHPEDVDRFQTRIVSRQLPGLYAGGQ